MKNSIKSIMVLSLLVSACTTLQASSKWDDDDYDDVAVVKAIAAKPLPKSPPVDPSKKFTQVDIDNAVAPLHIAISEQADALKQLAADGLKIVTDLTDYIAIAKRLPLLAAHMIQAKASEVFDVIEALNAGAPGTVDLTGTAFDGKNKAEVEALISDDIAADTSGHIDALFGLLPDKKGANKALASSYKAASSVLSFAVEKKPSTIDTKILQGPFVAGAAKYPK